MNLGLWPEAVPFDPEDGAGSPELEAYFAGLSFPPAAIVLAGRGPHAPEWAPRAAIGVARALAATGRDVLLADLGFASPGLDRLLPEPLAEGLGDVLLFGASLERVAVRPPGQPFEFVPAGDFAPDPRALMDDPGWGRLLPELEARNVVFLGFARFDAPGLDRLVARIPSIILLADPADAALTVAYLPEELRIEAMVRPPRPVAAPDAEVEAGAGATAGEERWLSSDEPASAESPVEPERGDAVEPVEPAASVAQTVPDGEPEPVRLPKDEARDALIADLRARQRSVLARAGAGAGAAIAVAGTTADTLPESGADRRWQIAPPDSAPEPRHRWRRWAAGAAVVLGGAGAAWFLASRNGSDIQLVSAPPVVARPQAPPEPVGAPVGWSVAVEAHDRLDAALASVAALAAADRSLDFYISPAVVSGSLWYRVLAGPLADSTAAVAAMEGLVDRGLKRAAAVWDVRATPLAFLLGRFQLESDAIRRMNELRELDVPTYPLRVSYSRGEPWYHLYAGAYSSPPEAERMGQLLRAAGLPDSLVVRVGWTTS